MQNLKSAVPLFALAAVAQAQNCTWHDGSEATNFVTCDPGSPYSNCCLQGEQCLSSGLCYGALGLVYRGACTGWGNPGCPEFCNSIMPTWANLYACAGGDGAAGPIGYWCGTGEFCHDNDNVTGTFHKGLVPGNVLRVAGATTSAASVVTTTVLATVLSTAKASKCPSNDSQSCPTGVVAGSVGGPLLLVAAVFGGLWAFERRRRRQAAKFNEIGSYDGNQVVSKSGKDAIGDHSSRQGPWEKDSVRVHELEHAAPELPDRRTYFYELSDQTPRLR